jgi:HAD superfamily hydrolase (TIGR01549 family)
MAVTCVVFDVGETLVDETRHWGEWADWMGVPRFTFFALKGVLIERGLHHREVFQMLRPGFDYDAAWRQRLAEGYRYNFEPGDFYPDALPCLAALRTGGYRLGVVGNQPEWAEAALEAAGVTADFIASSARWGVEKPSPAFFARVVAEAGVPADQIAYVGDRIDNDILPARAAGMTAAFIRRGPWGYVQAQWPQANQAHIRLESLADLPGALAGL